MWIMQQQSEYIWNSMNPWHIKGKFLALLALAIENPAVTGKICIEMPWYLYEITVMVMRQLLMLSQFQYH